MTSRSAAGEFPTFLAMIRVLTLWMLFAAVLRAEPLFTFDFSGAAGPYSVARWAKDWPGCEYEDGLAEGHGAIVSREGVNWLRVLYPQGSFGADKGGAGWRFPFARHEAAELRYAVRFDEQFDFLKGGKLPGLCGGPKTITGGDAVNGEEGFSARVMWRKDGRGQAYVYHMHQPSKYGDEFDFPADFRFEKGKPCVIRLRVEMNAAGKRNGTLRVWADDRLVVEKTDLQWRRGTTYGVDSVLFNTFHGGGDASWAPPRDVWAEFSGFQVRVLK